MDERVSFEFVPCELPRTRHRAERSRRWCCAKQGQTREDESNKQPATQRFHEENKDQAECITGSAMPTGFMVRQSPRVKSGMPTGMLPVATERTESSITLLHAAAS